MEFFSNKIDSIKSGSYIFCDKEFKRNIYYTIKEEGKDPQSITIKLPYYVRPNITNEIESCNDKFVNGFKVAKTSNGEYAYIRETDNALLPYRYDIATDFNEYGFAMVAKDGRVTWINKNFQYLSKNGEMIFEKKYQKFDGFQEVHKFSTGEYPLSRVYDGREQRRVSFYFSTEGEKKKFYEFDGKIHSFLPLDWGVNIDFKDKDYIFFSDGILFSKGYYCPLSYIFDVCNQNGIVSTIYEEADKSFQKEKINKK